MLPEFAVLVGLVLAVAFLAFRLRRAFISIRSLRGQVKDLGRRVTFDAAVPRLGNEEMLQHEWSKLAARYQRHGDPFAVVLMEVRHVTNPTADLPEPLVIHAARSLVHTARIEDTVCRLDERTFATLLTTTDYAGALRFVDRARGHLSSEPVKSSNGPIYLVMVAGAAEWQTGMADVTDLLEVAATNMDYERRAIASQQQWPAQAHRRSA